MGLVKHGAALAAVLALAGCTMGPDFAKPQTWSPADWFASQPTPGPEAPMPQQASVPVAEPIEPQWWESFNDPELAALEARAATASLDVRVATLRLAESRAQRQIVRADELPQLNGDASYQRELPSQKGVFSLLGAGGGGSSSGGGSAMGGAGGVPAGLSISPFDLYQYGFDASWELDLWGKVRRSIEGADATIEASAEARRDTLLSTLAEIARDYLQLRGSQAELAIARENLTAAQESLRLTRERFEHGFTTELDVKTAAAQVASTASAIPQLEQQEAATINQLGFLLGEPPAALAAELRSPKPIPPVPPRVPIGLPSELAERRPDIRQAEAQLHAQTAEIGVAEANFYPSVTLNGSFDLQATKFANLGNWDARTYSFGPSISIPIFEGGRLSGNLILTKAEQQEAAIAFQRTVLNAWREVDNALTAFSAEQRRHAQLTEAVAQNRQALALARQQYGQGLTDFLRVLSAEQQLLQTEQQEADSATTIGTNLVALYKALGGGWETAFPRGEHAPPTRSTDPQG